MCNCTFLQIQEYINMDPQGSMLQKKFTPQGNLLMLSLYPSILHIHMEVS